MPLLSIVIVFLLARYAAAGRWLHQDDLVDSLLGDLAGRWPRRWVAFIAVPVACSLLVLGLLWYLSFWPGFFLGLLVLMFSIGRGDWSKGMGELAMQLREGNAESIWLLLEAKGLISGGDGEPGQGLWLAWRRYAGCWYLDRVFAVFFWFFVLGPVGALFYRLVCLYNHHAQVRAGDLPSARACQFKLEWLPARYMGLCCCLAGNFTPGFTVWRQLLLDTQLPSADFLARCLEASMLQDNGIETLPSIDDSVRLTVTRCAALEELMVRTEIIGLVGLAVAILVSG